MASSHSKVSVALLVTLVTVGAASAIAATLPTTADAVRDRPATLAGIVGLTLALQLLTLRLPAKGSIGFASLGLVLAGIALGAGPALVVGVLAGLVHWIRTRGLFHRALFDAGNMALGAGAAAVTYDLVHGLASSGLAEFVAAAAASAVYVTINHALLCVAMSLSESRSPRLVWLERFHWARYYLLGFGPVAGTLTIGDDHLRMGVVVSLALSLVLLLRMRHDLRSASPAGRPA
jgi:hypothetical protein